ncbi:MAG TPA: MFS transporter [Gemmatimonadaceae bacterium]|nr:MFS transporter [Gemmatimonadaceae bacterium]
MTLSRSRERLLIAALVAIQFTNVVDFVIMMPLGPQLMRAFGIGPQAFGLIVSSYTFSAAVSGLFGALVIDRFDRKTALLAIYAGFALATLGCALAPTHHALILARVVAGAFGGLLATLVYAIVGDAIPYQRRGAATGAVMAAFSLATVLGVPLGLWAAGRAGWHAPFALLSALATLVLAAAWYAVPAIRGHLTGSPRLSPAATLAGVFGVANHRWAFALMVALMFGGFTIMPFLAPFLVSNVGLAEGQLPYVYMLGGAATAFTSNAIGRLSDRFGKARTFVVMACVSVAPILLLTNLTALRPVPLAAALAVTTAFVVVVSGRMVPALALVTSSSAPQTRGSFMSVTSSIQQCAAGLASLLSGLIIVQAPDGALQRFDVVGAIAVAATLSCVAVVRKVRAVDVGPAIVPAPAPVVAPTAGELVTDEAA